MATVKELREKLKKLGVKGYSSMNKSALEDLLQKTSSSKKSHSPKKKSSPKKAHRMGINPFSIYKISSI